MTSESSNVAHATRSQRPDLSSDGFVGPAADNDRIDAWVIGFPLDFFPVLFAVPRVVGWLAHWRQVRVGRAREAGT